MRRRAVLACAVCAAGGVLLAADPPPDAAAPVSPKSLPPISENSEGRRPLPISLPTAFRLADARALDVALAAARVRAAAAALDRAELLWLPNIVIGSDYTRHDGQIQDIRGNVFGTSRSSVFLGAGPNLNVAVADALFVPLSARQIVRSRQADLQATANDTLLSVSESYFNLQQARGELSGAESNVRAAEDLVRRTEALAQGLAPPVEANRARAELSRRRQTVASLRERWLTASAELARILRLDVAAQIEPVESPALQITIIDPTMSVDDLIPIGLTYRPELASRQALVQAALAQLRQERLRPLVPSVLLRGISTSNPGLAGGVFGGGENSHVGNFSARSDWDVQLVWELQNLGLGNRARVRERRAEYEAALIDVFRVQDRVAAEVAQAFAQVQSARARQVEAAAGLREAQDTLAKSIEGLSQTRRVGEFLILIVRPSEAVQAVQALAQAYTDFYAAVADYNRAQFRLYRALGHPAQCLASLVPELPAPAP
ncbi:MAG TPA: TolC family protein [Gemmataceae bacterium]|nr:TolC family protein [Gemmataceae bacterium]